MKEAVHNVVNVFLPQNVSLVATLNTSSLQGASLRFRLRPEGGQKQDQEVVNRYHMIYYLLATQYNTMRQYTFTTGLQKLHHWVRAGRKSIQPVKGLKTRYW